MTAAPALLHDPRPEVARLDPPRERFLRDVIAGLSGQDKALPCKYLYDARGSSLFDEICTLEEYYPTRTELSILEAHVEEIARALGEDALVVEYGSGSSNKTTILLDHLARPAAYVPVDIAKEALEASARALSLRYPELEVLPVCADFTQPFSLPRTRRRPRRPVVYFPGSTIGNFTPDEAARFLAQSRALVGEGGAIVLGVDLDKDPRILERAYDDERGVTAAFNENLLVRINRELGADFDLDAFEHRAVYHPGGPSRVASVEMQLVSLKEQEVRVAGRAFRFARGEAIHTEWSHKYTLEQLRALARRAGLVVARVFLDPHRFFSVSLLEPARP